MTTRAARLVGAVTFGLVASFAATAGAELALSNLRVEGITVVDGVYVSFADLGRRYTVHVDFQGDRLPDRVRSRTRWDDGRADRVTDRVFEIEPTGPTSGTLVIRVDGVDDPRPRTTDWWVEDDQGVASNTLAHRFVIR